MRMPLIGFLIGGVLLLGLRKVHHPLLLVVLCLLMLCQWILCLLVLLVLVLLGLLCLVLVLLGLLRLVLILLGLLVGLAR